MFRDVLAPLLDVLELRVVSRKVEGLGGLYELRGDQLMVRLMNDRGVASLEIAPLFGPADYWDLELISGLFEPPPSRGVRLLNLEQQAELLRNRWVELTARFSPASYSSTRKELRTLARDRAEALFGKRGFGAGVSDSDV